MPSAAAEPDPGLFAAHALGLRSAGVAGEAGTVLTEMPGAGRVGGEARLGLLWAAFFDNAIVKLGRVVSPAPVALYYNPLLDIALVSVWERRGERFGVASLRALAGERLVAAQVDVPLAPSWMAGGDDALGALARTTAERLEAFRAAHPAQSGEPGRDAQRFAAAAADLRAVLPRLLWNAAQRTRWTEEARPWLRPVLAEVEAALAAGDAATLTAMAPDTDAQTAAVLARLPQGFAARLALDLVLATGAGERLLIGSPAEDGAVYVLVRCRLTGEGYALRPFDVVSVLE